MATFNFTSFSNNTVADANAVTTNFQNIKNFVEASTVQVDGSVKATTASINDAAITNAKLASAAVTKNKLGSDMPLGVIARETRTTDTAWGTALNCFNGLTFTPVAGRLYRISFSGFIGMGTTDYLTTKSVAFVDGSNNVINYIVEEGQLQIPGAPGTYFLTSLADSYLFAPVSSTPTTVNVRVWRTAGEEAFRFVGSATKQNFILVEDLGLA